MCELRRTNHNVFAAKRTLRPNNGRRCCRRCVGRTVDADNVRLRGTTGGVLFVERPLFPNGPQQHGHAAAAIIFDYRRPPIAYYRHSVVS